MSYPDVNATIDSLLAEQEARQHAPSGEKVYPTEVLEVSDSARIEMREIVQTFPSAEEGQPDALVINGISLDIGGDQITMILGPSGCGKSTLMNMMGGMRPYNVPSPTSGTVLIDGSPCSGQHDDVVTVFQRYTSFPHLTVFENVMYSFRLKVWKRKFPNRDENEARVRELLKTVGLLDKADHYPEQLSGGQQQRVALARSLAVKPRILLMDEPLGALDAQTRSEMQDLLRILHQQYRTLIVFVTHDIDEALKLGDRILVLSSRPATIATDITIDEPKPRPLSFLTSEEGNAIRQQILNILEEHSS